MAYIALDRSRVLSVMRMYRVFKDPCKYFLAMSLNGSRLWGWNSEGHDGARHKPT
jgi:hypothetical protein